MRIILAILMGWNRHIWIDLLGNAPMRAYGKLVGGAAKLIVPRGLRQPLFRHISRNLGIDPTEAEHPLGEYSSLGELFVRRLKAGARLIDEARNSIVSPVDGCVSGFGTASGEWLIQAKGIQYTIGELLGSDELAKRLEGGTYMTLYLRPKDYHRIHAPVAANIIAARRIPGGFFPVQPWVVRNLKGLFVRNERLILEMDSDLGKVALVCVGAAGVGSITTLFNTGEREGLYDLSVELTKGDELAAFNLGSTVIVIFERGNIVLEPLVNGQEIRVGQVLAHSVCNEVV
ncbi:MAG: archaetidylserine decarboxylase [Pseudomonadota bacterium]